MSSEILSVPEAAKVLNLGIRSVWSLIQSESIQHMRIGPSGGKVAIRRQWCDEYLVRCTHSVKKKRSKPARSASGSSASGSAKQPSKRTATRSKATKKKPSSGGKLARKTQQLKTRRKRGAK